MYIHINQKIKSYEKQQRRIITCNRIINRYYISMYKLFSWTGYD